MLSATAPQFLVDDLDASIFYYTKNLGFSVNFQHEDFYAGIQRGSAEIHLKLAQKLQEERDHRHSNQHIDAYIWTNQFDKLFTEFNNSGAIILYPPTTQPWGVRDFYIKDIDDYIICFGQQMPGDKN